MELAIVKKQQKTPKTEIVISAKGQNKNNNGQQKKKQKAKNQSKRGKGKGTKSNGLERRGEMSRFIDAVVAPDIVGPTRIPRFGASQRTGLAIDRTSNYAGATTLYTLVVGQSKFYDGSLLSPRSAVQYTSAAAGTNFGSAASIAAGQQFPKVDNIQDVNLTACAMLLTYVGSPLNCQGEILLGSIPSGSDLTQTNFNALTYYPGVLRIPLSTLLNEPLRVFGTKASPAANEFIGTTADCDDYQLPFFAITNTVTNNAVNYTITRNFEYRSSTDAPDIVPYEKATPSFSKDMNIYEDAMSVLSEIPVPVQEGVSEYLRELALGSLGAAATSYLPGIMNSAANLATFVANRHMTARRARVTV